MVGHHLNGHYLYLRVMEVNVQPFGLYGFAQCRQFDTRLIAAASLRKGIAHEMPKDGAAPFHFQRNHIHTPRRIVVMDITAFHRSIFLSGVFPFCYKLLVCHWRYALFSSPLIAAASLPS